MGDRSDYYLQSVARAVKILSAFSESSSILTLSQLTKAVGLSKSTTYRVVRTLEREGFLQPNASGPGYRLGSRVVHLGHVALLGMKLAEVARAYLKELSDRFCESSSLSILSGDQILYLERVETQQIIRAHLAVGSQLPAYCTSMGKVLLAALPAEKVRQILAQTDMRRRAPNTITDIERLLAELARVRKQGYAINNQELEKQHMAVAAPVRSHTGQVIAAINLSVPLARVSQRELESTMRQAVVETAAAISQALG